jgi:hypothetical protein
MKNLSKFDMFNYLNETTMYEFPLLKNMTYIKNRITNINIGNNTFFFDFDYSNAKFYDRSLKLTQI